MDIEINLDSVKIPPCPWSIVGLIREARKDEPDMNRIISLISHDPAMTMSILKTVNSPLFGYARNITAVGEAIIAIGMDRTISLALACKVSDLGQNSKAITSIWEHSRKVAELMPKLTKSFMITEFSANTAYTAGLLHDAGMFLMLTQMGSMTEKEFRSGTNSIIHAELGAKLLEKWGMPEIIYQTARYHHLISTLPSTVPTSIFQMVAIMHLAERIGDLIENPFDQEQKDITGTHLLALDILEIDVDDYMDVQYELIEQAMS